MTDLVLTPTLIQNRADKLLLASGSAARRRILENAGLAFDVEVSDVDEAHIKHEGLQQNWSADTVALRLAEAKALSIQKTDRLVIGADQMLSCDGTWYDKPGGLAGARQQLLELRGKTHTLHTAVVLCRNGHILWRHVACPKLSMRTFSHAFVEQYLALEGEACLGCVGSYRLEGPGIQLFAAIEGDAFAIQGLPLLPLVAALREMKVLPD
ncbi:MAG: Maf family protein [Acetobacter fabarum]|uniref:Maf family protein n=1 Tax=Acetobacter fabarum TaxID=483199 RepID=UPI00242E6C4F|nr:nucleoside triphosphate pyrophosphatase [Acetobacter fabarum]MCH4025393.1 Maf family protein [Acetobacter fabarum]MCH4056223.1 Maf family protein [Acetobacter fabarum]MCH4086747.1 Maf family protein [Acetobacter fabarum]MCH4128209.1 Maf family protein [Acetobacter fabarum]MCH4138621.1 Maf family protein [Acetobacter fabarum]